MFSSLIPLTGIGPERIVALYEELLPEAVLLLRLYGCVSKDTHLWPGEFADIAVN